MRNPYRYLATFVQQGSSAVQPAPTNIPPTHQYWVNTTASTQSDSLQRKCSGARRVVCIWQALCVCCAPASQLVQPRMLFLAPLARFRKAKRCSMQNMWLGKRTTVGQVAWHRVVSTHVCALAHRWASVLSSCQWVYSRARTVPLFQ